MRFDLVVFTSSFFSSRADPHAHKRLLKKIRALKELDAAKIMLPQDEHRGADQYVNFIKEFGVNCVFSVAPESEWPKIYATIDFQKVKFYRVLTGYLERSTVTRITSLLNSVQTRSIDVGYRARQAIPSEGRHGFLKVQIADIFKNKAPEKGLVTDISYSRDDTFLGDNWYKFLLRCKYTIGVEGGSSLLDRDYAIRKKTVKYLECNPEASFEEIESSCFKNLDGSIRYFAISPRHLEACATKTCQVLIEGNYNDVLIPGKHYIELKKDFSNLEIVLNVIKKDKKRAEMIGAAYEDIVRSGKYTYERYVQFILEKSLKYPPVRSLSNSVWARVIYHWVRVGDRLSWTKVAVLWKVIKVKRIISTFLSENFLAKLRRLRAVFLDKIC